MQKSGISGNKVHGIAIKGTVRKNWNRNSIGNCNQYFVITYKREKELEKIYIEIYLCLSVCGRFLSC